LGRTSGARDWPGVATSSLTTGLRAIMRPFDLPIVLAIVAGVVWYVHRRRGLTREA